VVASITPGALPVKLGGLAGLHTSGAWLALLMAVAVAVPGTALTVLLVSSVAAGGESAVRYVELASVGITVFIIALLVHYIDKVLRGDGKQHIAAVIITVVAFVSTGMPPTVQLAGHLVGRDWAVDLPRLSAVQLIGTALVVITARALLRRGGGSFPDPTEDRPGPGRDSRVVQAVALLTLTGVVAVAVALMLLGSRALPLLGLVAVSTVTSFGGGEAYVGVADGFFVAGGYVSSSVFYSQLVPIANALPGPILVKLAAGVGYAATAVDHGPAAGWLMAALVAITACTAIAVVVMGAYHRAESSPVVRDIGRYILPVICGLLITTSVSMLNASADVSARVGAPIPLVLWASLVGIAVVTWLRHRRTLPDVVLLLACGALSLGALVAA
jgi:chromate transporter